ncbi:MAG: hypothetical protein JO309_08795 [Pseudonocardiales bacterium]|nr:hypothetical protein [Pseudonocardiales bacterium]
MSQTPGAVLIVVLALAGSGILAAFRSGARSGHRLARHSQEVTRMGGNLRRALGTAAVIVAVQWAVVLFTSDPPARAVVRRFVTWWWRSQRVPTALKSRPTMRQAAKDMIVWFVRSPCRFVGAVSRGAVVTARGWRRWVRVHDYRQAAEQAEKLADTFLEIRPLTVFRCKLTAAALWSGAAAVIIIDLLYGAGARWVAARAGAVALVITSRRKGGSPGRKAVLAGPRTLSWTMDPQVLVDAVRDAKLIGKDESLRLGQRATHPARCHPRGGSQSGLHKSCRRAPPTPRPRARRRGARTASWAVAERSRALQRQHPPFVVGWLGSMTARRVG